MRKKVFSVYDSKAGAFLPPIFAPTDGVALRSFGAAVRQEGHEFNRYAEDYTLFWVGEFDEETGVLIPADPAPRSVALASTLLASDPA